MRNLIALTLILVSPIGLVHADADCRDEQRYIDLANDAIASSKEAEAIAFLRNAVAACPTSYRSYQQLATILADSSEKSDWQLAGDAFISAHGAAATDQERAEALHGYASLLLRDNDPEHALPLAQAALALEPDNVKIVDLNQKIRAYMNSPEFAKNQIERIDRGTWVDDVWKPFNFEPTDRTPGGGGGGRSKVDVDRASVSIPINFYTGSVKVDSQTEQNVDSLASALVKPKYAGRSFMFVGHADERGSEVVNMALSVKRAEAVYEEVTRIEPSLRGRIEVVGRGESEPIDREANEEAYRTNRRLQVVLK